jgi:hypothetical protein
MNRKKDNQPYLVIHPIHATKVLLSYPMIMASIDVGTKNFAIRIEYRHNYHETVPLWFDVNNFGQLGINRLTPYAMDGIIDYLSSIPVLKHADIILIEKQVSMNTVCLQVESLLYGYFIKQIKDDVIKSSCMLVAVNSKLKGWMLQAPKSLTSKELKKWATDKAINILAKRDEDWSLSVIQSHGKKDDLCDTIVQLEAFLIWIAEKEL